jgi:hypothetical protein
VLQLDAGQMSVFRLRFVVIGQGQGVEGGESGLIKSLPFRIFFEQQTQSVEGFFLKISQAGSGDASEAL